MSGGCGGSDESSSTNQSATTSPPSYLSNAYQNLLSRAQSTGNSSYQPYTGELVAQQNNTQTGAIGNITNAQGLSNQYTNSAANATNASTQNLWSQEPTYSASSINNYYSPYQQDVVNSTKANIEENNAEQQQAQKGNAISTGAWGGDRSGIASSELARQQNLAENQTLANLENQGYTNAQNEFNTQQQTQLAANEATQKLQAQAGQTYNTIGTSAMNNTLAQAEAQLAAGSTSQNTAQKTDLANYQQYEQAQQFPYSQLSWLSGIEQGIGGVAGGTTSGTTTATQNGSMLSSLEGLGMTGASMYYLLNRGGVVPKSNGGGVVPFLYARGGKVHPMVYAEGYDDGGQVSMVMPASVFSKLGTYRMLQNVKTGGLVPHKASGGILYNTDNSDNVDFGASYVPSPQSSFSHANFPTLQQAQTAKQSSSNPLSSLSSLKGLTGLLGSSGGGSSSSASGTTADLSNSSVDAATGENTASLANENSSFLSSCATSSGDAGIDSFVSDIFQKGGRVHKKIGGEVLPDVLSGIGDIVGAFFGDPAAGDQGVTILSALDNGATGSQGVESQALGAIFKKGGLVPHKADGGPQEDDEDEPTQDVDNEEVETPDVDDSEQENADLVAQQQFQQQQDEDEDEDQQTDNSVSQAPLAPPSQPMQRADQSTGLVPTMTPKQHDEALGEALLTAGLATMGGTSHNAFVNLGRGSLQGVQSYQNQRKEYTDEAYKNATIQNAAQRLQNEAQYHKDRIDIQSRRADQQQIYQNAMAQNASDRNKMMAQNYQNRTDIEAQKAGDLAGYHQAMMNWRNTQSQQGKVGSAENLANTIIEKTKDSNGNPTMSFTDALALAKSTGKQQNNSAMTGHAVDLVKSGQINPATGKGYTLDEAMGALQSYQTPQNKAVPPVSGNDLMKKQTNSGNIPMPPSGFVLNQ